MDRKYFSTQNKNFTVSFNKKSKRKNDTKTQDSLTTTLAYLFLHYIICICPKL